MSTPKPGEFAQEFLITEDNCLSCFLGLDFMVDQECILNIGEQLLYSTKHRTALPISKQTTTGVRTFAIAERNARITSRHKKLKESSYEIGTVFSSKVGLIEGIQEFEGKKPDYW